MTKVWSSTGLMVGFMLMLVVAPSEAQRTGPPPGRAVISLYRIAPGKHVDFLRWLAAREALEKEAGSPPAQFYAHIDGDSWDFAAIVPELEPAAQAELEKRIEAAAVKKGMAVGPKLGMEIRQYLSLHTDTIAAGPMTAQQLLDAVTK